MAQFTTEGSRQRKSNGFADVHDTKGDAPDGNSARSEHPAGPVQHGNLVQVIRMLLLGLYFSASCLFIHGAQLLGAPLYFINRDYFYAYMALTKQHFGLLITTITQWCSPTTIRVSGDESMRGQLNKAADGRLECDFPERLVLIANHQIYTDWLYLWWIAYTSHMHGHIYIILKQSLKFVPVIGPAMMFYGFIFVARKWATDQARIRYRLRKLNSRHQGPMSGPTEGALDPMWLLLFPEGTNLSENTRKGSARWAEKQGTQDLAHCILPRSTGLQFCLQELRGTLEWVYDCTIAYEGVPRGQYGQDLYALRSVYLQGRPPKSVNMYWRRFKVSDIPFDDKDAMEQWTLQRWREKDHLLEQFLQTGRFPADTAGEKGAPGAGHIETEVQPSNPFEILQIFVPVVAMALIGNILIKMFNLVMHGRLYD
ncbi:hypothetical protein LTR50_001434 [Elasticomyces elasticus]|nr:hypothetical protein LTR50_001434 [Elasticomyces elasticus]